MFLSVFILCFVFSSSATGLSIVLPGLPAPGQPGGVVSPSAKPEVNNSTKPCCNDSPIYCLGATQDVWLEGNSNKNSYDFLIVGKHPSFLKKRTLIQFANIPTQCSKVKWAKIYIKYWYSHKASYLPMLENIPRTFQVHQIKKEWKENEATSTHCKSGVQWSKPYLALDGTDAVPYTLDTVAFPPTSPWIEFDVTEAAQNWKAGQPNYGLLIWATNENDDGRDIRFFSRERNTYRPRLFVFCN